MKIKKFLSAALTLPLTAALAAGIVLSFKDDKNALMIADAYDIVYGDVNGDGAVTADDVDIMQKYLVNKAELSGSGASDFDRNGKTDVFDVIAVKRRLINAVAQPPVTTSVPMTTASSAISGKVTTTAVPAVTSLTTAATTVPQTTTTIAVTTLPRTTTTIAVTTLPQTTTAIAVTTLPRTTTAIVTTTTLSEEEKINAYVNRVAELVNEERAKKGIPPVKVNAEMVDAAMLRAKEISVLFSHTRPDGTSCFTVLDDFNIRCSYCSENIAAGSATPENTMNQWINSEGHYNNLMSPKVSEIGVGYYCDLSTTYRYYWVQLFRNP